MSSTRRVRYAVGMSLDACIAGPAGEYDWLAMDPAMEFDRFLASVDTMLMGRKTFEIAQAQGHGDGGMPGITAYVISRTLRAEDHPAVVIASDPALTVRELQGRPGKDIWLMGGGELFRTLLAADLVDTVELGVMPMLLGGGIPMLPPLPRRVQLKLTGTRSYPSGIVSLEYDVMRAAAKPKPGRRAVA